MCPQLPDGGSFNLPAWVEELTEDIVTTWRVRHDEDCLFVNVQTPPAALNTTTTSPLPVLVSIHGGSYLLGSGSGTNASELCADGVVYVSMNYRLGVFGGLALPESLSESNTTGNWALADQRFALEWVQRNIHKFGGDRTRVTISGESAGGMAVAAHVASPRSAPLFSQAILMSGNDDSLLLGEAYEAGARFASTVGCDGGGGGGGGNVSRLECLRAADTWVLLNHQNTVYNGTMRAIQLPVADGYELPRGTLLSDVYRRDALPSSPSKALLAGSNADDISLFLGFTVPEFTRLVQHKPMETLDTMRASLPRYLPSMTPAELEHALHLYDPHRYYGGDARRALYALTTDGYYACPTLRMLNATARGGGVAFGYLFNVTVHDTAWVLGLPKSLDPLLKQYVDPWLGAFHGANEKLFWSHDDPSPRLEPQERSIGEGMVRDWTAFVRNGQPRASTAWPRWNASTGLYRRFDVRSGHETVKDWHRERCDFLGRYRFIWNPPTKI